jgi:hypothetical protein
MATGAGGYRSEPQGGSHRPIDPATRRNMIAAGGALALAGQLSFSHITGTSAPLLPDFGAMVGTSPSETTVTELAATAPLVDRYDGLEPVVSTADVNAVQQADTAKLVKAAGLNEAAAQARAAQEARLADSPEVRGTKCAPDLAGLAGVKPWVSTAGTELRCIFDVHTVGGLGGRPNVSDHPRGLAVDFMTAGGVAGDQLADYALKYRDDLRIKYVIWKQRINFGDGWHGMPNRGSATANHFDHVHISFNT